MKIININWVLEENNKITKNILNFVFSSYVNSELKRRKNQKGINQFFIRESILDKMRYWLNTYSYIGATNNVNFVKLRKKLNYFKFGSM